MLTNRIIKGYEFGTQIGTGGFGIVYRAHQSVVGRDVAIKVILPQYASRPEFIRRFDLEAQTIARLEHPHIVPLYDYWREPDSAYLVMRWLPRSLRDSLADGPWAVEATAQLLDQVTTALHVAHRKNIVHRDIKPDNILLDDDGNAYLSDFGIAKDLDRASISGEQAVLGTLAYTTPEQIKGEPLSPQTDLYSLGVLLFELLSGSRPFPETESSDLIFSHLHQPLPPLQSRRPDLPPALDAVIQTATAKDPHHRYRDALRLAAAFRSVLASQHHRDQPLISPLTDREMDILDCILSGLSNGQITEKFVLSPGTVKWYVKQIYSKLDVHTREQAIDRARELGFAARGKPSHAISLPAPVHARTDGPTEISSASAILPGLLPNLPTPSTPFIGREPEIADLAVMLSDPGIRLVTILGPGGIGKTRLALELMARQQATYANGTVFVPLAALNSPEHMLTAIADALKFSFYQGVEPKQQLLRFLQAKHMLLALDNFEQLLGGASLLSDILDAAPGIKILVTSRERLNLSSETIFRLRGMDLPESEASEHPLDFSAAQLFVERVQRVRHGFQVQGEQLRPVVRICRLVDGMPLGIILAAAWSEMLSPAEIAEEMSRSLDFLEADIRDLPERQRSIRAVFNASWARLSEPERGVFMKLSVFRGGFTRGAAQTVAGASLRTLANLVNKSLVWTDLAGRYGMHELLRQYAAEQLEASGDAKTVRAAHSTYYLTALYERKADLEGANQLATLDDIDIDLENVRTAWLWAAVHHAYAALGNASHSLYLYYSIRGNLIDGERLFSQAAASLHAALPDPARNTVLGDILIRQADFAINLWQRDTCDRLLAESRELIEPVRDPWLRAMWLCVDSERIPLEMSMTSRDSLEEALVIWRRLGDRWGIAKALRRIGVSYVWGIHSDPIDVEQARSCLQEAYTLYKDSGDLSGMSYALSSLCVVAFQAHEYQEAVNLGREGIMIRRRTGNPQLMVGSLINVGENCVAMGQLEAGKSYLEEALATKRQSGVTNDVNGFDSMGETYVRLGNYPEARRYIVEGLSRIEKTEQYAWMNYLGLWLVRLDWIEGNYEAAANRLIDWLAFIAAGPEKADPQHDVVWGLAMGCYLEMARGRLVDAQAYHIRLNQEAERVARQQGQMIGKIIAVQLALAGGSPMAEASQDLETAIAFLDSKRFIDISPGWERIFPTALALATLSRVAGLRGDFDRAYGYIDRALHHARKLSIPAFALMALTALADLLAWQQSSQQAVELAALVEGHESSFAADKDTARRLLKTLEAQLDPQSCTDSHRRGSGLDLESVTAEFLAQRDPA